MTSYLLIFFPALAVRLAAFGLIPAPHFSDNAVFAYINGAKMLLEGNGFSDPSFPVYTPPLYSSCIALVTFLFNDGLVAIKLIQIMLDSVTAVILYSTLRKVFSPVIAYLTGLIWGFYPFAIYSTLYIGPESIFTFLLAIWVWFVLQALHNNSSLHYGAAGFVLGLATLTRGTTQFLPIVVPAMTFHFWRRNLGNLVGYFLMVICFTITIAPWGIRNYIVLHDIIPVGINSMPILMGSSKALLTIGDARTVELNRLYEYARSRGMFPLPDDSGPRERDNFLLMLAMENYRRQLLSEPFGLVTFMVEKFFRLWYSTESGRWHWLILILNAPIYSFAVVGMFAGWKETRAVTMFLLGLIGYFAILHLPTLVLFRFMLPVMPYVIAFAALGVAALTKNMGDVKERNLIVQ